MWIIGKRKAFVHGKLDNIRYNVERERQSEDCKSSCGA